MAHDKGERSRRLERDLGLLNSTIKELSKNGDDNDMQECKTTDTCHNMFLGVQNTINEIAKSSKYPLKDPENLVQQEELFDTFPDFIRDTAFLASRKLLSVRWLILLEQRQLMCR
jgi:hypothetical protein